MGNKDRSDKIKDDASVKVTENLKNGEVIDKFSDCQSYNEMGKYNIYSSVKEIENRYETGKYFYKGNTENIAITSKDIASDSIYSWQRGLGSVQGKRKMSEKEKRLKSDTQRRTKGDAQNYPKEKFEFSERRPVQRHFQRPILKSSEHETSHRVCSNPMDSNKCEIDYQNTYDASNMNIYISPKCARYNKNTVEETLDVSMAKLNLKTNEMRPKYDSQTKKLNTIGSTKHPFKRNEKNSHITEQRSAITKTLNYTQTRKKTENKSSNFITDIKEQDAHIHIGRHGLNTVLEPAQLTLENEMVSSSYKILKDDITNQTYSEETPSNKNLGVQVKGAVGIVKQLGIGDEANLISEEKFNYIETNVISGHKYKTQTQDDFTVNHFEHSLQYYWYDNYYLPCQPVTSFQFHPYVQNSTFRPHFSENSAAFNQQACNEQLFYGNHSNELPNIAYYNQNIYQSAGFEQNLGSITNDYQNFSDSNYYSENLTFGYCEPFVIPWCENGMMYFQYYPDFSPVEC